MRQDYKPYRQPTPADFMASELAADMLSYIASLYNNADDDQKLDIILRYSSVMHSLQRTINKTAHSRRRQTHPGKLETK